MSVLEPVVVGLAVLLAAAYVARRAWRALRGRSCGCGSAGACPAAKRTLSRLPK